MQGAAITDEALVEEIRRGEIAAFDVLYERHEARLFAYLRAVLEDRHDAEEVLHDAFLSVLSDAAPRPHFDKEGAFRAWLYQVARNMAFNRRRSRGRRDKVIDSLGREEDVTTSSASPGSRADHALEARELESALVAALGRLPTQLFELWHLRTSGLSYEEIANVVDAPLGTIKSRMHQMVNVLREELKPWTAPK